MNNEHRDLWPGKKPSDEIVSFRIEIYLSLRHKKPRAVKTITVKFIAQKMVITSVLELQTNEILSVTAMNECVCDYNEEAVPITFVWAQFK